MSAAFKCDNCGEYFDGAPARVFRFDYTFGYTAVYKALSDGQQIKFEVCKTCDKVENTENKNP